MRDVLYTSVAVAFLLVGCSSPEKTEDPDVDAPVEVPTEHKAETPVTTPIDRKPTKEIIHSVEGQDETIKTDLVKGHDSLYSLYIDKERYIFETSEDKDVLRPVVDGPKGYPEVKMEFLMIDDKKTEEVKEDLKKDSIYAMEEEYVTSPVAAISLHGKEGVTPESEVTTMYLLEAGAGTLLITETYFLEAQEGHGARFLQMLETLELNE
ncbi:hypothetical protein CSV79_05485 [Sporosarcina sp. P13]|uniref:hypothetical protein n=1 Tax=Sporosarcina sp. P13 TaxID=2048263 RepID=UPI000C172FE6|nr:hypothetical protein [Sporosarcina sp. P13]PIC64596.1 hypothetical protein CSV79_05485 [Sporosarcina sp. P13]